jgi:hypothetical protein
LEEKKKRLTSKKSKRIVAMIALLSGLSTATIFAAKEI